MGAKRCKNDIFTQVLDLQLFFSRTSGTVFSILWTQVNRVIFDHLVKTVYQRKNIPELWGQKQSKMLFSPRFCSQNSRINFFDMQFSQDGQESSLVPVCTISGRSFEWFLRKTAEIQKPGKNASFTHIFSP